ncbi:MAG: glycoside hydrolase family 99-like domain-containing protein [Clostridia bacterium]|nr:glycoside hydrolase family 99-like domain-containing protein [Clostridia bacterium]
MYNIKLENYVPKPIPATSDRIIAAHYYPAWKKGAAGLHRGFDDLHNYPERTPLIGYYDGDSHELCDWEIKWALEHGINCFIFCWYRNKSNVGHPVTINDLRLGETLHNGFFNAKYCGMMNFAIMFEAQNNWGATDSNDMIENLMPFWLDNYFSRDNYLKIDGKPVVFIYDYQNQLRDGFSSAKEQKRTFDSCREMAKSAGFEGLIFAIEHRKDDLSVIDRYRECGYDFSFAYCWSVKQSNATNGEVIAEQIRKMRLRAECIPDYFCPTVSCMWDPSPRFVSMPTVYSAANTPSLWKLTPSQFRSLLRQTVALTAPLPKDSIARKFLMLDNWNEWDEGHYLLPSHEFGFGYLQAVREELTVRDNLPDYRMPREIGLSEHLNQSWDEPDLKEICQKKFGVK